MADVKVPFYGHVKQYLNLKKEIDSAIEQVLMSGTYVMGPTLAKFEQECAEYMGVKRAVGLNSGTDALWLLMEAYGIGPGDEVITTSNTFFATAEAVWIRGATCVFVDIDPRTCNMDLDQVEAAITPRTKAIIPVHLYGQMVNMKRVAEIAKKHNLLVIEDCAQAMGAAGPDFRVGQYSDGVGISFITAKNLGTFGDSGAILTNRDDIADKILRLRNHGSSKRSVHSPGWNSRLDEIHAAILRVKLPHLDEWNDLRRARAKDYAELLKGTSLQLPYEEPGYRHIYHLYVIEHDKRDDLQAYLKDKGIIALTNYPIAIHQQEGFPWDRKAVVPKGGLPHTERSAARVLSLPLYPELTRAEVEYVAAAIKEWDKQQGCCGCCGCK